MGAVLKRRLAWAATAALVFLALAAADLALRSRSALNLALRYEAWAANPAARAAWLDSEFAPRFKKLDAEAAAGKLPGPDVQRARTLLTAEKEFLLAESSTKLAYTWYKTAAYEFRLPFNPWAAEAKRRLPGALAAWRAELAAAGHKPEPWMTE